MGAQTLRQLIRLLITTTYSNRRIVKLSDTSPNTVRRYRRKLKDTKLSKKKADKKTKAKMIKIRTSHARFNKGDINH